MGMAEPLGLFADMTKVAVLIDGGFFLKRLPTVQPELDRADAVAVSGTLQKLVENHLRRIHRHHQAKTHWELLYRAFYYDANPLTQKAQRPISRTAVDYARSESARFRNDLFAALRRAPNFAVRLGETYAERQWVLRESTQKDLIAGRRDWASVTDEDFSTGIRQKAVDMRLGLDFASITLKRQASIIVLVTGDSDFVPAAKLARREGVRVVLDALWQQVKPELHEHIDGLYSGFRRPGAGQAVDDENDDA